MRVRGRGRFLQSARTGQPARPAQARPQTARAIGPPRPDRPDTKLNEHRLPPFPNGAASPEFESAQTGQPAPQPAPLRQPTQWPQRPRQPGLPAVGSDQTASNQTAAVPACPRRQRSGSDRARLPQQPGPADQPVSTRSDRPDLTAAGQTTRRARNQAGGAGRAPRSGECAPLLLSCSDEWANLQPVRSACWARPGRATPPKSAHTAPQTTSPSLRSPQRHQELGGKSVRSACLLSPYAHRPPKFFA